MPSSEDDTFAALTRTPIMEMAEIFAGRFPRHVGADLIYRWAYAPNPTEVRANLGYPMFFKSHGWTWFDVVNTCREMHGLPKYEDIGIYAIRE